jgi:hypothetical protein
MDDEKSCVFKWVDGQTASPRTIETMHHILVCCVLLQTKATVDINCLRIESNFFGDIYSDIIVVTSVWIEILGTGNLHHHNHAPTR